MSEQRWRLLNGGPIPEGMVFVSEPPGMIGDVLGAWTNNGPAGPARPPLWQRTTWVWVGAMAGLVVGLVGFFVVGGILQLDSGRESADAFLRALGGGALLGAALGGLTLLKKTPALAYFVGTHGCAQVERSGERGRAELLDFRDVEAIRTHVSVMTVHGIRTAAREFHVTSSSTGKERLWFVSAPPGEQRADDPQFDFGEAVLRAFEAFDARRASAKGDAYRDPS
ncbi:MAG: hypothetical protein U0324_17200 [Polyangiales bacterium]